MSTVAVLGAGSWGTTLAIHLCQAGAEVRLWGNVRADLAAIPYLLAPVSHDFTGLRQAEALDIRTVAMAQGQKQSRFVAWSFLDAEARRAFSSWP